MSQVGVVMGSKSDIASMQPGIDVLKEFGIDYEVSVISAHRTPEKAREYAMTAKQRGIEVIIAGAGGAAHLPGVLASWTTIPVIGVPLPAGELKGLDALYSIVQMPGGVPVACVGIGSWGAKNAALLSVQVLSIKYDALGQAFASYKARLAEG
ncbi:MAG: 5-(carboxyamino)imidazole ribonucleotide mutase [Chloroflexi bacterium]|nr:5-(carboxyamino)imidazole ribonucleotide mutase [Chloroflexota bacterium]